MTNKVVYKTLKNSEGNFIWYFIIIDLSDTFFIFLSDYDKSKTFDISWKL